MCPTEYNKSWANKYDTQAAWKAAIRYVMPEAAEAFQIFAAHNSDPGPNGHRYRREESVHIKPAIDSFFKAYKDKKFSQHFASEISNEFQKMVPVAGNIRSKSNNKRLLKQLSPWRHQFELLANSGVQAMEMARRWNDQNYEAPILKNCSTSHSRSAISR